MNKPFSDGAEKLSAIATHLLGWSPDQFWRVTPKELSVIFGSLNRASGDAAAPLDNNQLEKLKEKFPDGCRN